MLLIDRFNRRINYLRISVTDRCNLYCIYCRQGPPTVDLPQDEILTYEEIFEIIKIAQELGVEKFRLTGGEPLLRKGLIEFLGKLSLAGIRYSLTTNGLLLKKYANSLSKVGLAGINISLDTLNERKFAQISGNGSLNNILTGIETAEKAGLTPIKINTVVMKDINEDEIENFIHFFSQKENFHLRFIEYMPFKVNPQGEPFQSRKDVYLRDKKNGEDYPSKNLPKDYFFPLTEVEEKLQNKGLLYPLSGSYPTDGPARYYQLKDKNSHGQRLFIGFITPRSHPFCGQCNRLRLASDGKLRSCLASPIFYDLKKIIREEKNIGKVKEIFVKAVSSKPEGHHFQFCGEMIKIGG